VENKNLVLKTKANGKLEIKLNGSTLVLALQGVHESDIDLGTVESSISRIELPFETRVIQSLSKSFLSGIPYL
jgi:hypothetical protein